MSEQELRDRLHAEVDSVEAPGNLALLVEKGARRRRRNRAVVAAAAVAVVGVLGAALVAVPRRAPAPVAAPAGCAELPAPAVAPAPPDADVDGWTLDYRGDPALDAATLALAAPDLRAKTGRATAAVPLLGIRSVTETAPNAWVYALALRLPSGWHIRIGAAEQVHGKVVRLGDVLLPLPAPAPGRTVSAFVGVSAGFFFSSPGSVLVVLGPRGTERIDYAGCRDGQTFGTGSSGDFLVATMGPVEEAGQLTVRAGGRVFSASRPQDVSMLPLTQPPGLVLPGGPRTVTEALASATLLGDSRSRTVNFGPSPPDRRLLLAEVEVFGVCAGRGTVRFADVPLPCDGRTHRLWAGTLASRDDAFPVVGEPDPATGRTSLVVQLAAVTS